MSRTQKITAVLEVTADFKVTSLVRRSLTSHLILPVDRRARHVWFPCVPYKSEIQNHSVHCTRMPAAVIDIIQIIRPQIQRSYTFKSLFEVLSDQIVAVA